MQTKAHITGTGFYVPDQIVTNDDIAKTVDTSDEWIYQRTGIRERRLLDLSSDVTSTVDMATFAAERALKDADCTADSLNAIIFATCTPDYRLPSAACLLQLRIGAHNAFAFDVVAACAGSLFGLSIANQYLQNNTAQKILVIGAESLTSIVDWSDRKSCVLFGDAASAAVLEPSQDPSQGFVDFILHSDPSQYESIKIEYGGSKKAFTPDSLVQQKDKMTLNGREVYKFATRSLVEVSRKILQKHGLKVEDIDHVVAHQANMRIIEAVAGRLEVPLEKFIINIDKYANTSSASLLATFHEGRKDGRIKSGDRVLMLAIGAGIAYGAGLYIA